MPQISLLLLFKALQLANMMAAGLVLHEALPPLWRYFRNRQPSVVQFPEWLLLIGALAIAAVPVLAWWKRITDRKVLWLGFDTVTPFTAVAAMLCMFALLFWFHHLLTGAREGFPHGHGRLGWKKQHRLMLITLAIGIGGTGLEAWAW